MKVARYPAGARRGMPLELRLAEQGGVLFIALHDLAGCISGPLGVPLDAVSTLRSALGDVLGEHGTEAATEPERAATGAPGSGRPTP